MKQPFDKDLSCFQLSPAAAPRPRGKKKSAKKSNWLGWVEESMSENIDGDEDSDDSETSFVRPSHRSLRSTSKRSCKK